MTNDSGSGYEVYEDKRDFTQTGITGKVSRYSEVDINYPYFMIVNEKDNKIPRIKMKSLPTLLLNFKITKLTNEELKQCIQIYFREDDKVIRLGQITPKQVKPFLKLFDGNNVECMLSKDKKLTGEYMYILSS